MHEKMEQRFEEIQEGKMGENFISNQTVLLLSLYWNGFQRVRTKGILHCQVFPEESKSFI